VCIAGRFEALGSNETSVTTRNVREHDGHAQVAPE